MTGNNSEILFKNMFSYSGYGCRCVQDIQNTDPGEPPKTTVKMVADENQPLLFSYAPKEGLNLTGPAGGVIEGNILGKLLAVPSDDIQKHVEFIERYGFFQQLVSDEYTAIADDALFGFFNRIKATVRLMNAIAKREYKSMLINATYLLYSPRVEVLIGDSTLATCYHRFTQLLNSYNLFPDYSQDAEAVVKGTITVPDTMKGSFPLDYEFYQAVRSGTDKTLVGSNTTWYKHIMAMYVGCRGEGEDIRRLIDFYFHFQTEVSIFQEVSFRKIKPYGSIGDDALTDEFKSELLRVARIVVTEEINYNIAGIHPKYEGAKLTASWQVDNLIEALYFSVFYMKPGVEIYKECENPNCKRDRYFLVEATRGNKKYCCPQCANAAAAQRHRSRKMKK